MEDEPFALLPEPPSLDDRIVNQAAALSVIADPQHYSPHWRSEEEQYRDGSLPDEPVVGSDRTS